MRKTAAEIPLHLWESFIAVIEEGTFQKAAEKLTTSQPTITRHIHQLEESLPLTLFELRGRTKLPTPFAYKLYRQVRTRFASLQIDVESSIKAFAYNENVQLRIACPQELSGLIMKSIEFKGGVSLFNSRDIQSEDFSQFDLVITKQPHANANYRVLKLSTKPFVALVPMVFIKDGFKKRDLQHHPFCLYDHDPEIKTSTKDLNILYKTSWWESSEQIAHQGLAWTLAPAVFTKKNRGYKVFQSPYKSSNSYYVYYSKNAEEHQWAKKVLPQIAKLSRVDSLS